MDPNAVAAAVRKDILGIVVFDNDDVVVVAVVVVVFASTATVD